ncbi:MAG: 50S ribosomal protein L29 [bacterium]|nr:50S ribosomal protein L29 [bacterium]
MKIKDLRAKSAKDLEELLKTTTQKIADSTFYHAQSRSKNVKEVKELRRRRARIITVLKEK